MNCRNVLLALALTASSAPALAAAPITGKWMTTERDSIIEIQSCGPALCGKVLRVFKASADGKPILDFHNPETALRTRPIEGINVLTGFTDSGTDWRGRIYDPKSGNDYKSIIVRNPDGTLKVQGCIGFFCRTLIWSPVR